MAPLLPQRLRRDPERSFERLYRTYVRDVYSFALALLGNVQDAEDVTQTTFLNAYRALERGERVRNTRAWLLAVAHNLCRQRFRTASRRPKQVELDPDLADSFGEEDAPSAQEIREALGKLAFNQRTVLVLRELEGLSYDEIAEAMGLSRSAVETLLFRARRALREQLEAADSDLGCSAVERLISLGLDGKLSRKDRGLLRAHLRACPECARLARSQRARARAMPALVALPLPATLSHMLHPAGGGFFASKAAAVAASAALVGTGALVTTGVVPVPGKADGTRREAAVERPQGRGLAAPVSRESQRTGAPGEATARSAELRAGESGLPLPREETLALPPQAGA
ncbi:MAG: sigma-70 family RNA polymerase sigma factor, partial [Actinomycetota bacterium]|nr:sigma-70 family RNA polymerase sigma factor [Actinomycetota bacterium]